MLNLVLLGGKALFLIILYLFVLFVMRAALKDVTYAGESAGRVEADRWLTREPKADWRSAQSEGDEVPRSGVAAAVHSLETDRGRGRGPGWVLVALRGPARGRLYYVPAGARLVIGRSPDADIHLADTFVSAHHARLEEGTAGLVIQDLASTNGTYVNGKAVSRPVRLEHGDEIRIGETVFRVEVD